VGVLSGCNLGFPGQFGSWPMLTHSKPSVMSLLCGCNVSSICWCNHCIVRVLRWYLFLFMHLREDSGPWKVIRQNCVERSANHARL